MKKETNLDTVFKEPDISCRDEDSMAPEEEDGQTVLELRNWMPAARYRDRTVELA